MPRARLSASAAQRQLYQTVAIAKRDADSAVKVAKDAAGSASLLSVTIGDSGTLDDTIAAEINAMKSRLDNLETP